MLSSLTGFDFIRLENIKNILPKLVQINIVYNLNVFLEYLLFFQKLLKFQLFKKMMFLCEIE
jgi:hypothetical protein